jgi:hypothetical protein
MKGGYKWTVWGLSGLFERAYIHLSLICLCVLKVCAYGLCAGLYAGPCAMTPFPTNSGELGKGI